MKHRFCPIVMLGMIILLTACSSQPASNPGTGSVPNDLQRIEAAAEDIIDFAPTGNWDRISTDVTEIDTAWKSYQAQAGKAGAAQQLQDSMTSALTQLQSASASKDAAATMQASNNLSAAVVELFALYDPVIPADIGRLDVLERQVILDIAAKDYAAAEASLSNAKATWERVKPSALAHNGTEVAAEFEASLAVQQSALENQDDAALTNEAKNGLEIVDSLERLY